MALLALSSLYRHTFLHVQSPLSSVLKTGLRSFILPPDIPDSPKVVNGREGKSGGTPEMPKVANRIEENSSKDEAWTKKSKRAMTELSALPMVNPYSGASHIPDLLLQMLRYFIRAQYYSQGRSRGIAKTVG